MIIKFEDLTGEISALVKFDNKETFAKINVLRLIKPGGFIELTQILSESNYDFPVIDYSQICRRVNYLEVDFETNEENLIVAIDGSGEKVGPLVWSPTTPNFTFKERKMAISLKAVTPVVTYRAFQ